MTRSLIAASWRAVARPPLLVPVGVAVLLTLASFPLLDDGYADQIRLGTAVLLASAWAVIADDPAREVAAASPYSPWRRCAARLLVGACLVLPVAALSLALGELEVGPTPSTAVSLQVLAVLLLGPAIGFGLWAWVGLAQPAYAATIGVLCASFALWLVPSPWHVMAVQPWGPPWEAGLIRWAAVLLLGLAIVASAWREPVARR